VQRYDAIVLGAGGIGSAALYHIARRGVRVLGVDRFQPPHDRGSTHGHTRVIRQAYFEHSDYVPLLLESYRRWYELEQQAGRKLFHQIGLIQLGPADGLVVSGVMQAAAQHQLIVERLTASEVQRRWPGLSGDDGLVGVFEPAAGYLFVEDCVQAHLDAARAHGAELLANTEVLSWSADAAAVRVQTTQGEFSAKRLIITAGAWASQMITELNVPLTVRRKSLFWFATTGSQYEAAAGFPVFLFELPHGIFYGFPKLDERGVKFAEHSGGQVVADPLAVDRAIDENEKRRLTDVLATHLPDVSPRVTDHSVCLYTMTPDEHFIVDRHPTYGNVAFVAGLSGHGFKFAPVLGQALADLALDGGTGLPIDFLSASRFAP
jgi:monomeric sarcosine oxidase